MTNPLLSKRQKRGKDQLGLALLMLTIMVLGTGLAAGIVLRPAPTDPRTFCPVLTAPSSITMVLIDGSEQLEPRHRKRLFAAIEDEANRLPRFGRLMLVKMRPQSPRELKEVFLRCNPGDSRTANPLFSNPARVQARWQADFADPLRAAANLAASAPRSSSASPILEAIAAAALDPAFANFSGPRRFVLITDLLEHDPNIGFSTYSNEGGLGRYVALRKGFEPPDLLGTDVRVVVLDRAEHLQRQITAREELWKPFFERSGARDLRFEGL